jgi:hypothetical protein
VLGTSLQTTYQLVRQATKTNDVLRSEQCATEGSKTNGRVAKKNITESGNTSVPFPLLLLPPR